MRSRSSVMIRIILGSVWRGRGLLRMREVVLMGRSSPAVLHRRGLGVRWGSPLTGL